ncbi:MAG TPA: hypothetical protein DCY88_28900 [Cyanobacteria bacterium UBA11372]|nr:hypothetical protein [Cyanobacteria bacterium UBA11372]
MSDCQSLLYLVLRQAGKNYANFCATYARSLEKPGFLACDRSPLLKVPPVDFLLLRLSGKIYAKLATPNRFLGYR